MTFTRQRKLKQHLFLDQRWMSLPVLARLLFLALGWYADDEGREELNVKLLKGMLFSLDDSVTESAIEDALLRLDEANLIHVYASGRNTTYFQIAPWADWWSVDRPQPSSHPALSPREPLASDSRASRDPLVAGERGSEESERAGASAREPLASDSSKPPSPFCRIHPTGTDEDCRMCGRARLARKLYDDQRMDLHRQTLDEGD